MGVIIIDVMGDDEDQEETEPQTQKEPPKQMPEGPMMEELEIVPIEFP